MYPGEIGGDTSITDGIFCSGANSLNGNPDCVYFFLSLTNFMMISEAPPFERIHKYSGPIFRPKLLFAHRSSLFPLLLDSFYSPFPFTPLFRLLHYFVYFPIPINPLFTLLPYSHYSHIPFTPLFPLLPYSL